MNNLPPFIPGLRYRDASAAIEWLCDAFGFEKHPPYIIVPDVDAHHAKAKASGAKIVAEPMSPEYGGRYYSCLDPEGNLWHFGTYEPWE